jgi:hypothetical protein
MSNKVIKKEDTGVNKSSQNVIPKTAALVSLGTVLKM